MAHYHLAVIGAGSGGLGAALSAARLGLNVALIERAPQLGGNAVRSGVCSWESGCGGTGLPFDIWKRLRQRPSACGVLSYGRHFVWQAPDAPDRFPGGELLIDPTRSYIDTLQRHGSRGLARDEAFCREHWHATIFEPEDYAGVVSDLLAETGRVDVRLQTGFIDAEVSYGHVVSVGLDDGSRLTADCFVDGTADVHLAAACGCELLAGQDPRSRFDEPSAPDEGNDLLNAVTLIYRITPCTAPAVEPLPADVLADCWWRDRFPAAQICQFPNLDRHVNMLPTLEASELAELGSQALPEAQRRVSAHWHWLQTAFPEFRSYRLSWMAPALGVREGRRIVAERMLTEHDLSAGVIEQADPDLITVADHALDRHGRGGGACGELVRPYGVPFRSLVPRGFDNLLVACRGAGFSSLAASSCRLSRTMMQLGQAAGTAAWLASRDGLPPAAVAPSELRAALAAQRVQLAYPLEPDIEAVIRAEDAPQAGSPA